MAIHKVTMKMPPRTIGRADAIFEIEQDGLLFGTLTISKGSLVWFPRNTTKGRKIGWSRFALLMEEHARRIEKR
jgi:hypothetical protein